MGDRPVTAEVTLNTTRTLQVSYTNSSGTATSPGANPNFRQVKPDGAETNVTTGWTNPSTGVYNRPVYYDTKGLWLFSVYVPNAADAVDFEITAKSALP